LQARSADSVPGAWLPEWSAPGTNFSAPPTFPSTGEIDPNCG
jgi:hypothetical protein